MLVWLAVKATVDVATTSTVIKAVLEPYRFIAFIVTVCLPTIVNVWISGSWAGDVEIAPSGSVNVHSHWVGLPPDVSRNSTLNGTTPVIVAGDETDVMMP